MKWISTLSILVLALNLVMAAHAAVALSDDLKIHPVKPTVEISQFYDGHVNPPPLITRADIVSAEVAGQGSKAVLDLELTDHGGQMISDFTGQHVGDKLAFIVNGKVLQTPIVKVPITGKKLEISFFKKSEAQRLAKLINDGKE